MLYSLGAPLLVLLLSSSAPGGARADWKQDIRLAVSNLGLSKARFPPPGFECSRPGNDDGNCQCWGTDGRAHPFQVSGDPCRIPGGCLATECRHYDKEWKYDEAGSLDAMVQTLGSWGYVGGIASDMQKKGKKKSDSFTVLSSEKGCSGDPGKAADCQVWIGAVRRNAGVVQFGVARCKFACTLKKVYITKKCSGNSWDRESETEKRKFSSVEKDTIKRNMLSEAYFGAAMKAYPHSLSAEESRRLRNETFVNPQEAKAFN